MEFLDGLVTPDVQFFGLNLIFKLLFFVIIVGAILYSFLLMIRVRILSDTIQAPLNRLALSLTYIQLLVSLIGGFLALIVILLA
jgi:hypothetical protein